MSSDISIYLLISLGISKKKINKMLISQSRNQPAQERLMQNGLILPELSEC